jgi:hypothetical protein
MAGPAKFAAATPVRTKMPVPMITPMPKTMRSIGPSAFLSSNSGSSVSRMDCSIDLVRMIPIWLPLLEPWQHRRSHRGRSSLCPIASLDATAFYWKV